MEGSIRKAAAKAYPPVTLCQPIFKKGLADTKEAALHGEKLSVRGDFFMVLSRTLRSESAAEKAFPLRGRWLVPIPREGRDG